MKNFDIEAAKAGKPVCTRDGKPVRLLCFDALGDYPITGLIRGKENGVTIDLAENFSTDGKPSRITSNNDLFMASEKREGWINLYKMSGDFYRPGKSVYNTLLEAADAVEHSHHENFIYQIKIEWEE